MLQEQKVHGLSASRLEQLCQPEHIEHTMHLLFSLNHWAKARERLFFADRQGLYTIKASLMLRAYAVGALKVCAYIDGSDGFGADLAFDMAVELATEALLWRLEDQSRITMPDGNDQLAQQLYLRITSKHAVIPAEVEEISPEPVQAYIRGRLEELEHEARTTRQPIPWQKLMELCIAPSDLLCIQDKRFFELANWDSWEQLDASDLRKLDPEGLSLVAFHFTSPGAHYVFHLPFRMAEAFLPVERLNALRQTPASSREQGVYYGRAITETESFQLPIVDILHDLGVDMLAICPHQLNDKQAYALQQATRYAIWEEETDLHDNDDEELDEIFWRETCETHRKRKNRSSWHLRSSSSCPLCDTDLANISGASRIAHWQTEHPEQDLTFSQANWITQQGSNKNRFCQEYPPDYRTPDEKGQGTRYWRLETLVKALQETGN
jgi:hypothetical protein